MAPDPQQGYLREIYELTKENNRILRSMRRSQRWGTFLRVVWWLLILAVPILLYYYYLKPFQDQLLQSYQQIQGLGVDFSGMPEWLQNFLRIIGIGTGGSQ